MKVSIVATVYERFIILVDGVQWGGVRDKSGAGDATFATVDEAIGAFRDCNNNDDIYLTKEAAKSKFISVLTIVYRDLFANDPEYAYASLRVKPEVLAEKMADGIPTGRANFHGTGIKRACKALGIKHTRKAITEFLNGVTI